MAQNLFGILIFILAFYCAMTFAFEYATGQGLLGIIQFFAIFCGFLVAEYVFLFLLGKILMFIVWLVVIIGDAMIWIIDAILAPLSWFL